MSPATGTGTAAVAHGSLRPVHACMNRAGICVHIIIRNTVYTLLLPAGSCTCGAAHCVHVLKASMHPLCTTAQACTCAYMQPCRIGDFVVKAPMVIGHESSGVVQAVGHGVTSVAVGDRVALEPGAPCWHCKAAREGRYDNPHALDIQYVRVFYMRRTRSQYQVQCSAIVRCCSSTFQIHAPLQCVPSHSALQLLSASPHCRVMLLLFCRYNLDPDIQFFATPPVHGSLATFVHHPAELCYKLPAS
jgi:hypothetical protein